MSKAIHRLKGSAATILALFLALPAGAQDSEPAPCETGASLDWIVGEWQHEEDDTVFAERWERASDGMLEGYAESYSRSTGERYMTESMRIERRDGVLQYIVTVAGEAPVAFALSDCDAGFAVWENPDNEFPKMLRYEQSEDGFTASVTDGDKQGFDLTFRSASES